MKQELNVEAIKKYNDSLREYKDKATKLRAELEFSQKELERQCNELSAELGMRVTPENVSDILEERIKKINNTLSIGTEILERVKAEENNILNGEVSQENAQSTSDNEIPVSSLNGVQLPDFMPPIFVNNNQ